jgi:hypothetical protein
MELVLIAIGFIGLAFAGRVAGADSRRRFDDEPHRSL